MATKLKVGQVLESDVSKRTITITKLVEPKIPGNWEVETIDEYFTGETEENQWLTIAFKRFKLNIRKTIKNLAKIK